MTNEYHLECVSKNGAKRTYLCKYEESAASSNRDFNVFAIPLLPSGEFFQLSVAYIGSDTVKITCIESHDPAYRAKGIPEALLPHISNLLNATVISSSNTHKHFPEERRSKEATRMWERLCKKGLAIKHEETDYYELLR